MKFKEQIMRNHCKNCFELTEQLNQLKAKLVDNKGYAETEEDIILQKISECEGGSGDR